jgi:hypothetical protein
MNQPGGWPRLEIGRRLTAVRFDFSSSAIFRLFAPGGRAVVSRRVNLPGLQAPPRKRLGVSSVVVRFHLSPRLKSMEGAPPARQRALKARGGHQAAGLDTSTFRSPGTAQLVEGAALIQRYRQVRFLGARPAKAPLA